MTQDRSTHPSDQNRSDAQTPTDVAELQRKSEAKHQECKDLSDELARLKNQLSEMENNYSRLFDSMQEGFGLAEIILDENGAPYDYRLLKVNNAFARLTGFSPEEILG